MSKPKILLLSAYHAQSHHYWAEQLLSLQAFDWQLLSLPGRHYAWRSRGNAMGFWQAYQSVLEQDFALLIATSMTDLANLRGLCPKLATIPNIIYFHENQFAYPENPALDISSQQQQQHTRLSAQLTSIYNLICADSALFNSEYNRQSFFQGAKALLKKLPDYCIDIDAYFSKTSVLAIPVDSSSLATGSASKVSIHIPAQRHLKLIWVARWEFDKGIDRLYQLLQRLQQQRISFSICILGQSFRNIPEVMQKLLTEFAEQISFAGFAESRSDYVRYLQQADIFISTSRHEFFGIAAAEAALAACLPLLPRDQVYPELYSEECLYNDIGDLLQKLTTIFNQGLEFTLQLNRKNVNSAALLLQYEALLKKHINPKKL